MTNRPPTSDRFERLLDRRSFLYAAGGAGAALALAACGSSGGTDPSATNASVIGGTPFHTEPTFAPPAVEMVTTPSSPGTGQYIFTDAHGGTAQEGPMILDRAGNLVWWVPAGNDGSGNDRVMNVRVQSYQGKPVLTYWQGHLIAAHGGGHYTILDTSYRVVKHVSAVGRGLLGDLHEFRLTPQGTALLTTYDIKTGQIPAPGGGTRSGKYWNAIAQEVDVATGKLLLEWQSDQHVPFSASHRLPVPSSPSDVWDYFHINSIEVDPTDNNLIISGRNMWSFYKVHRKTGELMWTLGGTENDFKMGPNTAFAFQHHVVPHAAHRMTIFDNESGPPNKASQSRGLELLVDETDMHATFVNAWYHTPKVLTEALGSVQPLAGGDTFVGWGQSSYFTQFDAHHNVLLDGKLADDVFSYRAFLNSWEGRPAALPKAAVVSGSPLAVYASWNGSTVHRSWKVVGGNTADALNNDLGTFAARGFETQMSVSGSPKWVAAVALDGSGATLASSVPVQV